MTSSTSSARRSHASTTAPTRCLRRTANCSATSFASCQDWGDVHNDIGPRGHLDAGRDLQDHIDALNEHGLIIYAGTRTLTLTGGERDSPWREAVLKVVHERDACVTTPPQTPAATT